MARFKYLDVKLVPFKPEVSLHFLEPSRLRDTVRLLFLLQDLQVQRFQSLWSYPKVHLNPKVSRILNSILPFLVTVKIGLANTAVVVTMDGTKTELISDANGKIEMNTCGQAKSGTIKVQGYCETALEIPANKNEIEVTLKQSGCKFDRCTCLMEYSFS